MTDEEAAGLAVGDRVWVLGGDSSQATVKTIFIAGDGMVVVRLRRDGDADDLEVPASRVNRSTYGLGWSDSQVEQMADQDEDKLVEYMSKAFALFTMGLVKDDVRVGLVREVVRRGARAALEVARGGDLEQATVVGYRYHADGDGQ